MPTGRHTKKVCREEGERERGYRLKVLTDHCSGLQGGEGAVANHWQLAWCNAIAYITRGGSNKLISCPPMETMARQGKRVAGKGESNVPMIEGAESGEMPPTGQWPVGAGKQGHAQCNSCMSAPNALSPTVESEP